MPPANFKKYEQRFIPPIDSIVEPPAPLPPPYDTRTDIFGQQVPRLRQPYLWKLTYKLNNPQGESVRKQRDLLRNQQLAESQFLQDYRNAQKSRQGAVPAK